MENTIPSQNIGPLITNTLTPNKPEMDGAIYFMASPYFAGFADLDGSDYALFLTSFVDLPVSLKSFLSSPKTANAVYSLAIENILGETEASLIAALIREVAVGNVFVKDLPSLLASKLNIDPAKASTIANKIAADLFAPIIQDLKRIQQQKFGDKIRMLQLESKPKIDTESFIKSQTPPSQGSPPLSTIQPKPFMPPPITPRPMPTMPPRPVVAPPPAGPRIAPRPPIPPIPPRPAPPAPGPRQFGTIDETRTQGAAPLPQRIDGIRPPATPSLPQKPPLSPRPEVAGEARSQGVVPPNLPRVDSGRFDMPPKLDMMPKTDTTRLPAEPSQSEQKGNVIDLRNKN